MGRASSTRIEIVKVMRPKYAINSRVNFYAPTMALLQQKYMFDNYNTKLLLIEKADDAIVQTFDKYGNYNMSVDNGKTYYLSGSGEMVHDKCMTINNKYYCFNSSGARTN